MVDLSYDFWNQVVYELKEISDIFTVPSGSLIEI